MNAGPSTSAEHTAQSEYAKAINFSEHTPLNENSPDPTMSKMKTMIDNIMKNFNDSKYLYPAITLVAMVTLVIIVLFQKSSTFIKIIAIAIFLIFTAFTIFKARQ